MKRFSRSKSGLALTSAVLLLLFCAFLLSPVGRLQVHAQPDATQPPLGTAGNFAVLGASTVTNTGSTVVTGDLGVSPGTSVTGFPPGIVIGTIHIADGVARQAQNDVEVAYVDAKGQTCNVDLTGQDLGGKTLTSGVYCFSSSAQLTGQLTLDSQGNPASVFIFQIGSTLTTASNASVLRINGTQACNIFWQVGSSATLGTNTDFSGNILAHTSITATTGAKFNGSLYARNGAVTLDTNTITRSPCAGSTPTATSTSTLPGPPGMPPTGSDPGGSVAFCQSAPIEIGNRVWLDTNGNGIQDPGEPSIAGVTVRLYAADGTTLLKSTITDAYGDYYFPISSYTDYVIKLDNPADYTAGPLKGLQLTVANQDTSTHSADSKGVLPTPGSPIGIGNYPQVSVGSHAPGQNDNAFDFGFSSLPNPSLPQSIPQEP